MSERDSVEVASEYEPRSLSASSVSDEPTHVLKIPSLGDLGNNGVESQVLRDVLPSRSGEKAKESVETLLDVRVSPTLKDFVSIYQRNKSASTLGQFYLKCTHPTGNPLPQGKKHEGDSQTKWVIAQGSWGRTVLMQKKRVSIRTSFNYEGSWPQVIDTFSSFEEKIARIVGSKGENVGKKYVMDPSRLIDISF
ncbi:hypothetical protein LWI28_021013 [Acer negundo]|uniref:Uncharacterized protein n=1 Tax=Acer negundo TaxID=4023 RepID=A0AAD5J0I9_ACENE|nr:hypothetical protein LWI28_021013 [Acer negundo]